MTGPQAPLSGAVIDTVMQQEQLRLHSLGFAASAAASAALGLVLVIVQSRLFATPILAAWLSGLLLVLLARIAVGLAHRRSGSAGASVQTWLWRYRGIFGLHGLVWAAAGLLLFPPTDPTHQILLVFALTGISVSALTFNAFDLTAALMFSVPTLSALVVRLFAQGDEFSAAMGGLVLMLVTFVALVALRANREVRGNAVMRAAQALPVDALQRSDRQLRRAEQMAHLGSFEWDPVWGELQCSDEHFRLWGLELDGAPPTHASFVQGIHPQDRQRQQDLLRAALGGGGSYESNYRVLWRDGSVRDIHSRGEVHVDAAGRAVRVTGTVKDITAMEKAKDALGTSEFVANSINDLVSVVDQDSVYRLVNDAWCRNTGLAREQVLGRRAAEVLPAVVNPVRLEALRECVEHQQTRVVRARVDLNAAGARFMETTLTPYSALRGGVRGAVAVCAGRWR